LLTAPAGARAQPTIPAGIQDYVPVTLSNGQSSATVAGFQQMLTVDWNTYAPYLNPGVSNVEFFDGSGTLLYGWCESSCSNTATSSVVWVNLGSDTIAGDGTLVVYIGFLSTATNEMGNSGSSVWGEAPQLSGTYGQYDDGKNVFGFYDNFVGSSLNPMWTVFGTGSVTVHNGVDIKATTNPVTIGIFASFTASSVGNVVDAYFKAVNPIAGYRTFLGFGTTPSSVEEVNGYGAVPNAGNSGIAVQRLVNLVQTNLAKTSETLTVGADYESQLTWQGSSLKAVDLTTGKSASATDSALSLSQVTQVTLSTGGGIGDEYTTFWYRVSIAPPSDTMPSTSIGAVAAVVRQVQPPLPPVIPSSLTFDFNFQGSSHLAGAYVSLYGGGILYNIPGYNATQDPFPYALSFCSVPGAGLIRVAGFGMAGPGNNSTEILVSDWSSILTSSQGWPAEPACPT
jgi:hypothetical protein